MADNTELTLNTQQKMDEALDQFMERSDTKPEPKAGQTTTKAQREPQQQQRKNSNRKQSTDGKRQRKSPNRKHSNDRHEKQKHLSKHNESLNTLTPLPEPTARPEVSSTTSNWGLNNIDASSAVADGGKKVRQYRMTLVGYSRVGKSALCSRFCDSIFKNDHPKHKELLFKKKIDLPEMPTYRFMLDILDTQGAQEVKNREIVMEDRYRKRTNHIMLFVFSVTSDKSFKFIEELLRIEYEQDQEYFERMGIVIVGNKCDLTEDREVETPDARDLARDYGAKYFETSAKTNHNVDQAFFEAVRKYHEKRGEMEETMEDANKQNCCNIL